MDLPNFEAHPIANAFPLLSGAVYDRLVDDIRTNRLLEPVWLYDGKVLDGRNRIRACLDASVEIRTREYTGADPVGFVISLNLHRRHLNESQRAMVAARMTTGQRGGNRRSNQSANLPFEMTISQAATLFNVSERSVKSAKSVQKNAAPELVQAIDVGECTVNAAMDIIKAYPETERQLKASRTGFMVGEKAGFAELACQLRCVAKLGGRYEPHPIAEIFPPFDGPEYLSFADSIHKNGLYMTIWIYEGKILDGRARARACFETGEPLRAREFIGTPPEAIDEAWRQNMIRAHLTRDQKIIIKAQLMRQSAAAGFDPW